MKDPVPWAMIAVFLVFNIGRDWSNTQLVAGADWLRVDRKWVATYSLTDVRLSGVLRGWSLTLQDSEGRKVSTYIRNMEANRELWAIVYNGIVHSVRNGATVNNLAASVLRLKPGLGRRAPARPQVPDRVSWKVLMVIAAVFVAIYAFNPGLLGPALAVFGAIVLVGCALLGAVLSIARKREREFDAQPIDAAQEDHDESDL